MNEGQVDKYQKIAHPIMYKDNLTYFAMKILLTFAFSCLK